jgi:hypothetical protein
MNRRELIINLLLLVAIAAIAYAIIAGNEEEPDLGTSLVVRGPKPGDLETTFNPDVARKKYPMLGQTALFQPIITPTPTPPPPTPTPTKTPDIKAALGQWRLSSAGDGEALIENRAEKNPEYQFFSLRVGQSRSVEVEKGVMKNATLKRLNENADNPSATFILEGTSEEYTLKMFD